MYWYNNSSDIAPNVTIGIDLQTTGPKPVTILDSGSDKINFSLYHCYPPQCSRSVNDTGEMINYHVWSFDNAGNAIADLYVYLPRGPNYTIMIVQAFTREPVVNRYSGGNLTLWVNDPDHNHLNWYDNWSQYNWSRV